MSQLKSPSISFKPSPILDKLMDSEKLLLDKDSPTKKIKSKHSSPHKSSPKSRHKPKAKLKRCNISQSAKNINTNNTALSTSTSSDNYFNDKIMHRLTKELFEINENLKILLVREKSSEISEEALKLPVYEVIKRFINFLFNGLSCCNNSNAETMNELKL